MGITDTRYRIAAKTVTDDLTTAAYTQNIENFRSLNQLMWQIPLIGMTLTGGLWFGVANSTADHRLQLALLLMAACGNVGLMIVLHRLRFIMQRYLEWQKAAVPDSFVNAKGSWLTGEYVVRRTFQTLLAIATVISLILASGVKTERDAAVAKKRKLAATAYYDQYAEALAENYEGLPFESIHPYLAQVLSARGPLQVLDVGAGTGRDAAWAASKRHRVTAVEPSKNMLALAKRSHPSAPVIWGNDALPSLETLAKSERSFDLVIVSAVWMHIAPTDRAKSIERLSDLIAPTGEIYLSFRSGGTAGQGRSEYPASLEEVQRLAFANRLDARQVTTQGDLLGRSGVRWTAVVLSRTAASSTEPEQPVAMKT